MDRPWSGAIGTDALHFRRTIGTPASVVPIDHSARALANTLADLGHIKPGARVLVTSAAVEGQASAVPTAVAAFTEEAHKNGALVERIETHMLQPSAPAGIEHELSLLADGHIDALCVSSPEDLQSLFSGEHDAAKAAMAPLILTLGEEAAAAAHALLGDAVDGEQEGSATTFLELGARESAETVVTALEEHLGAGRLLF